MRFDYSKKFLEDYATAPAQVQKAFDKQSKFLLINIRHPSLHAKKYDEQKNLWQARVNRGWRVFFTIEADNFRLHAIMKHPK